MGRKLLTPGPDGEPLRFLDAAGASDENRQRFETVARWLNAKRSEGAGWLRDCDEQGRPRRLVQYNLPMAFQKAAGFLAKTATPKPRNARKKTITEKLRDGEEIVGQLAENLYLVRLTTMDMLHKEGISMGHCMKDAGRRRLFRLKLEHGIHFYSLRDRFNNRLATLEIDPPAKCLYQCVGRHSSPPLPGLIPHISAFIREKGLSPLGPARDTGFIEQDGQLYSIYDLPTGFICKGDLKLHGVKHHIPLPPGLTVLGELDMTGSAQTSLPPGLSVRKNARFSQCASLTVIENATFDGNLNALDSGLQEFGRNVSVMQNVWLANCRNLKTVWPMACTPLTMDLEGTPMECVPALQVKESLNLTHMPYLKDVSPDCRAGWFDLDRGQTETTEQARREISAAWSERLLRDMQTVGQMGLCPPELYGPA